MIAFYVHEFDLNHVECVANKYIIRDSLYLLIWG